MILKRKNSRKTFLVAMLIFAALALQILFWQHTYKMQPRLDILKPIPSETEAAVLSFGDNELYFRAMALNFQFMGDTWGRSTPLKDYDYKLVYKWLNFLDRFDPKSNILPSSAAYYYSKTQRPSDVKYLLDYLEERADRDPVNNWWWLSQGIYLANGILGDKERAIRIAAKLRSINADMPIWAKQMEAFLREDMGEKDQAANIMCNVFETIPNIPEDELNFMSSFLFKRLGIDPKKDSDKQVQDKIAQIGAFCAKRKQEAAVLEPAATDSLHN